MTSSWRRHIEFLLLPGRCCLCDSTTDRHCDICEACQRELPWLVSACRRCAIPLPPGERVCGPCTTSPPPYDATLAPFQYVWPVDRMILDFKERGHLATGRVLAELLLQTFPRVPATIDLLVAVPLHRRKLRRRGFNQSLEIARVLGRQWEKPIIPGARRLTDTTPNKQLPKAARQQNLRHAFAAQTRIHGEHLMIVDDVMTTGATVGALAKTLLAAGAGTISLACIARTPAK